MGPGWGRMLGLWNDTKHPALDKFPTEANYDWQWMEIIRNVRAVNMDRLPRELRPIVYAIDDWNRNYKLGLIFECKVGKGRLLVSAFDLETELEQRPVAGQLRHSLLAYMTSAKFQPRVAVSAANMRELFFDTRIMQKLGAVAKADGEAAKAIDGDPNTFWLVGTGPNNKMRQLYELTVSFPSPVEMSGLVFMPRQNHREHEGDIREYMVQVSDDESQWRKVMRGELVSTFDPQRVQFPQAVTARYLKLTALSGFGSDTAASLAELAIIHAGPKPKDSGDGSIQYQRNKTATPDIDEGTDTVDKPKKQQPPKKKPRRP